MIDESELKKVIRDGETVKGPTQNNQNRQTRNSRTEFRAEKLRRQEITN